ALYGVEVSDGASGNTIGGTSPGTGNLISGNTARGFSIDQTGSGAAASGNLVEGNVIGLGSSGTAALGNGDSGVAIDSSGGGNTIGGSTPAAYNVIAGNSNYGIWLSGGSTGDLIQGNYV